MDPVERYLGELHDLRLSGAAVAETSGYPVLRALLDEVGKGLKPKVRQAYRWPPTAGNS
jgi:hypothetical protein